MKRLIKMNEIILMIHNRFKNTICLPIIYLKHQNMKMKNYSNWNHKFEMKFTKTTLIKLILDNNN